MDKEDTIRQDEFKLLKLSLWKGSPWEVCGLSTENGVEKERVLCDCWPCDSLLTQGEAERVANFIILAGNEYLDKIYKDKSSKELLNYI